MKIDIFKVFRGVHKPKFTGLEILKYIGPGLLVTVGFIDPGNWASNLAAGSDFGYSLLWMVTLSTLMLIVLQHNAAHLGIASGLCISEAASIYLPKSASIFLLSTAVMASIFTALAEILGGAIALNMLFHLPIKIGAILTTLVVGWLLYTNSYRKLERWIIGFVSIIGLSFVFELTLVNIDWPVALKSWVTPAFPPNSMLIIMSVLGAVVMPHNLYLHSEIIQSRQWNLEDDKIIKHQLKFEFTDTLIAMIIGWAINSSMILIAASTFFVNNVSVTDLNQAQDMLRPLLGNSAAVVFAVALLFSGVSSSVTAGMAGGSIFSGMFKEPFDIQDWHSKAGTGLTLIGALIMILFITDPFRGLVISQMILSIQLPFTIFLQIYLTSSEKIMGKHKNSPAHNILLIAFGLIVFYLNLRLLWSII